jgi:hypothetical protein
MTRIKAADKGAQLPSRAAGNRNRSHERPVVVGVADHNGWAILVSAAAVNGEPTVVDRRRVELIEAGVPNQPYHHETLALSDAEAEQLLRKVKRSIAVCTALAFDRLSADLWPRYRVSSMTIRQPPLAHLPATVGEVHRSYHAQCRADGMLYHTAICEAARQRDWTLVLHRRGEELAKAAEAVQVSTREVERFMNDLKQTLKPPWTAEHRNAFAAAIGSLRKRSRLRVPRTEPTANGDG